TRAPTGAGPRARRCPRARGPGPPPPPPRPPPAPPPGPRRRGAAARGPRARPPPRPRGRRRPPPGRARRRPARPARGRARRPEFAEGWNKRATVYYLLGEYAKSLADCDEVLKRNPYHFGALSGYGMIYLQLDQPTRALEYFERALAVNPNLSSVQEAADKL